jgi:Mg2+ and Co2+ transporter CorA
MSSVEPARHALYAELERVLGADHAETLMAHLPHSTQGDNATKSDISGLNDRFDRMDLRFDRMDDRFDRMEDRMAGMHRNFLTVTLGTMTVMTAIFSFITRI